MRNDRQRGVTAAVLTGAVVAAISIGAAWATGFLKPADAILAFSER